MKRLAALILLIASLAATQTDAQIAAAPTASAPMLPKKREKQAAEKDEKSSANQPVGGSNLLQSNEPTTTEIYADEAVFDSNKSMGIFSGRVKVTDPRFNLQSDKLTVFISKGENQGLERAIAEGNVGLVRDRPDPEIRQQPKDESKGETKPSPSPTLSPPPLPKP